MWRRLVAWVRAHAVAVTYVAMGAMVVALVAVLLGPGLSDPARHAAGGSTAGSADPTGTSGVPSSTPSASVSKGPSPPASARPTQPPRPPAPTGFPGPGNTGVPPGTKLTTYTGPCTITAANAVIDAKIVNCDLAIRAKGVIIKRSKINGHMGTEEETQHSYTLQDSEVNAGVVQRAAVGSTNMTILRSNIHGGQTTVYCWANCTIRDSWLHGQGLPAGVDWHLGAFLANDNGFDPGGRTNAVLVHNTIVCDTKPNGADGGCSGDINLYGDFGPISYVTLDNNFFGANTGISYCLYGGESTAKPHPNADHVVVINNVFERGTNSKCGGYGPVTAFDKGRPGNRWENNVWDKGGTVGPAN